METRNTADLEPVAAPVASLEPSNKGGARRATIASIIVLVAAASLMLLPLQPLALGFSAVALMVVLMLLRIPVALAMIAPSLIAVAALRGVPASTSALTTAPFTAFASWSLSVIPMFVLMGACLATSGVASSIYAAAREWLGWLPGGLSVATTGAGAGLAAVSGSSVATTYTLGRLGLPEMLRAGYHKRLALGSVMVAALPGQLIPPSILLIVYAGAAEVPVGEQLLAGIVPGLLVASVFSLLIVSMSVVRPTVVGSNSSERTRTSWSARLGSLTRIWPVPVLVIVVVGGMASGVVTATEAGAAAALVSLLILLLNSAGASNRLTNLISVGRSTISSVGAIFLLLVAVEIFSRMLALSGISGAFASIVTTADLSRVQFLLLMALIYLVLGAFMESLPMILLTVPVLLPSLEALDISLLWFGAFAVLMAEVAMMTPPVGILGIILFSISREKEVNIGVDISYKDVMMAVLWLLPGVLLVILLLIGFPDMVTWLPEISSPSG